MYRLPWSLNDNVLAWLEPTKRCNLYCEGCYSRNDPKSDKSLDQIRSELQAFVRQRRVDSISIAGGDPLVHPKIVEIVRMIRHEFGLKPIANTNGLALDRSLLHALAQAGIAGFTFHVDSTQQRPKWKGASERDLNELRLSFAELVRKEGDLSVAFNATITRQTLGETPGLVNFAQRHIGLVDSMVFILFRSALDRQFEYFANGKSISTKSLVYYEEDAQQGMPPLVANDVVREIRKQHPDFAPAAYLGGTKDEHSMKWLIATRIGDKDRIAGYLGPRSMEVIQTGHHALFGRYLAYMKPSLLKHGRSSALALAAVDPGARRAAASYALSLFEVPLRLPRRQHVQSILIIQPIDMMPDGEMNMCDGCPDMTVHEGKLVWSCRLDERVEHRCFLTAAPRMGCAPSVEPRAAGAVAAEPLAVDQSA
jgi:hypothetical protein